MYLSITLVRRELLGYTTGARNLWRFRRVTNDRIQHGNRASII
jgi:hypothetical protein